jgi:hypothetical protein
VSESAVSAKPLLLYGLARNRRSPKRPSEPRPSGAHPEAGEVGKDGVASNLDFRRKIGNFSVIAGILERHDVLRIGTGGAGRTLNRN